MSERTWGEIEREIRDDYLLANGPESVRFRQAQWDVWLAEVERAAAARALREFAQHLIESVMPEHGSHINMTQYREGLVDGVNRAVTAAGRRAAEYRKAEG